MDQALFEGFVTRDPLGFFLVGPPDSLDSRAHFTEPMFREFANFLVEKYESIVVHCGRYLIDDVVLGSLQTSSTVFMVITQDFPPIRTAQRYVPAPMRMAFNHDQLEGIVNHSQNR